MIAALVPCDLHRIEAADRYSHDYDETAARNVREQNDLGTTERDYARSCAGAKVADGLAIRGEEGSASPAQDRRMAAPDRASMTG
jgi:hypothetical protein